MAIWEQNTRTMSLKKDEEMYDTEHCEQGFIDVLQGNSSLVQVHLLGGQRLLGKIIGSDDHTILLSRQRPGNQMIYKTAITTISIFEEKQHEQFS
jgi:RNA chaperone Hfq